MNYVNLGRTGMQVSRICLGTMTFGSSQWRDWVLDEAASRPIFQRAIEAGINFFDTANFYSQGISEEVTGRALADFAKRDEVVIATKVGMPMSDKPNDRGLSRKHIMASIDNSLRRLGTDYIDLYQLHRLDDKTPLEETLEAMHDVVKAGKARYIGASTMFTWPFVKANYLAEREGWTRFVTMQNHWNLVYREEEREMNLFCLAEGIGLIPWSPLARGFLAGNRTRKGEGEQWGTTTRAKSDNMAQRIYYRDSDFAVVDRVVELAGKHNVKPAQIALAWLLHRPGVTAPIVGASKMQHLEDAVGALDIQLSKEEMSYLEEPYQPHPILSHS